MIITLPLSKNASPTEESPEIKKAALEALLEITKAVTKSANKPIMIIYDSDMDGYTSAAVLLLILAKIGTTSPVLLWPLIHSSTAFITSKTLTTAPMSIIDALQNIGCREVNEAIPKKEYLSECGSIFVLDHAYTDAIEKATQEIPVIYIDHHPTHSVVEEDVVMVTATFLEHGCVASTTGIVSAVLYALDPALKGSVLRTITDLVDYHDSWKYGSMSASDTLARNYMTAFYADKSALALTVNCCNSDLTAFATIPGILSVELNQLINLGATLEKEKAKTRNQLVDDMFTVAELGIVFYRGDYDMIAKLAFERGMCRTIAIVSLRGDSVKCSIRSVEEAYITARELSEELGGGGHKHSAGFICRRVGDIVNYILQAYSDIQYRRESLCRQQ